MGKDITYSSKEKSTKMRFQLLISMPKTQGHPPLFFKKSTTISLNGMLIFTYWERLQSPTITNGQVIQTKIKQRNSGDSWCYKPNDTNRYLQNNSHKQKNIPSSQNLISPKLTIYSDIQDSIDIRTLAQLFL